MEDRLTVFADCLARAGRRTERLTAPDCSGENIQSGAKFSAE